MKLCRHTILVILALMITSIAVAQSASDLYRKANEMREKGQFTDAAKLYNQVKSMDSSYSSDCDYWLERISKQQPKSQLKISTSFIEIPYQGGKYEVRVTSTNAWSVNCDADWIKLEQKGNILIISAILENSSTKSRTAVIDVISGNLKEKVTVMNEGAPVFLYVTSNNINFTDKGGDEYIGVETNEDWIISLKPAWCEISVIDKRLRIIAQENTSGDVRTGVIRLSSSSLSTDVNVSQLAASHQLDLSKTQLYFPKSGGTDTIKVYSGHHKWELSDFPYWCSAAVISDTTLLVTCAANDLIEMKREGGIKIRSGERLELIAIYQEPAPKPEYVPIAKIVSGRDVSFGLVASYDIPVISANASSQYTTSLINYSLGDEREERDYKPSGSFTVGAYADIRLFRNLYLNAGVNFSHYGYTNGFDQVYERTINWFGVLMRGETDNQYEEKYSFNLIDIPLKLSYRFPIDDLSFCSINLGPVLSFGLNADMEIHGNTFSPLMDEVGTIYSTEDWAYSISGGMDLYSNIGKFTESYTGKDLAVADVKYNSRLDSAPYKKNTFGGVLGVGYEYRGFAIELEYYQMFSNIALDKFWKSQRFQIFTFGSDNTMSGYRQRNNRLQVKFNYTFRYKKK